MIAKTCILQHASFWPNVHYLLNLNRDFLSADMPGRQPNKLVASKLSSLLQDQVRLRLQTALCFNSVT